MFSRYRMVAGTLDFLVQSGHYLPVIYEHCQQLKTLVFHANFRNIFRR